MSAPPVRYTPDVEHVDAHEEEIETELIYTLLGISRRTYADTHHGHRSVHAKSHALLGGELIVPDDLPPHLAQGLFAQGGRYPLVMRFSTTPGDILPDSVSTPRGLAVKVIGVPGERLADGRSDVTQDFVMVNAPVFSTANAREFLNNLKLVAATTDQAEGFKVAASAVLRGAEKVVETFGGKSGALRALGGEPATHPLGETYYSQTAMLFGDYMAKLSIAPVSEDLTILKGERIDISKSPTAIREAMLDHFSLFGGEWELRAQLCTDLRAMPIEDAAKVWPENLSPYVPVARIVVQPQVAWSEARAAVVDDGMAFSPWHGLAAHRPLGSINRLRRRAYEASARFRAARHGKRIIEPRHLDPLLAQSDEIEVFYP